MAGAGQFFDAREMYTLHRMFRREFSLMPQVVQSTGNSGRERVETVARHIDFVTNALHGHHEFEDAQVWPILRERGAADIVPHVRHVEEQHEEIDRAAAELEESVTYWRGDATAGARERVSAALDRMLPVLLEHMRFEEENVVPVMEKCITLAEWNQMIQASAAEHLAPTEMPLMFGMTMYEGDPEIVDAAISNMPAEIGPIIRRTAAQAFAMHAEKIHGMATPPRSTQV
ncbi:hemerythrin domain-containing protein [Pseudonocardia alaniniphila]|uniref:Hemerythrin domain-containing protein n=1 Tax=Pseudonocardia alaniniphila TaxID=75291 RepID=A0ABS9T9D0_9PSEU|nr:hemerythrin domain-containing protein [Pseudonocardia alaniniphila]MCH6165086.1 hemerythrin domain-containing protein [Pseudonocardia alaniniphila]